MGFEKESAAENNKNKIELTKALERLNLPDNIVVTSASAIKVDTVKKALKGLFPKREFIVTGVKASSDVSEQPVGEEAEVGAKNRIVDAERIEGDTSTSRAFISIENGIFKTDAQYEDRAVVVIKLPDGRIVSEVSPRGVPFPPEAIEATLKKEGGFKNHTVGSTIAEMLEERGLKIDKQDPHSALTDGKFTREEQIISAIRKTLEKAASN